MSFLFFIELYSIYINKIKQHEEIQIHNNVVI